MEMSYQLHAPAALTAGTHWIGGWVGPRAVLDAAYQSIGFVTTLLQVGNLKCVE
jgi:hypothetical protein